MCINQDKTDTFLLLDGSFRLNLITPDICNRQDKIVHSVAVYNENCKLSRYLFLANFFVSRKVFIEILPKQYLP